MQLFAVLLSTVALAVSTIATPLHVPERRDVSIDVTIPKQATAWYIGAEEEVCWRVVTPLPALAVNIYLFFNADSESEPFDSSDPTRYVYH